MWLAQIKFCMYEIHVRFWRPLPIKKKIILDISFIILYSSHVEMVTLWIYWVNYIIKVTSPVSFYFLIWKLGSLKLIKWLALYFCWTVLVKEGPASQSLVQHTENFSGLSLYFIKTIMTCPLCPPNSQKVSFLIYSIEFHISGCKCTTTCTVIGPQSSAPWRAVMVQNITEACWCLIFISPYYQSSVLWKLYKGISKVLCGSSKSIAMPELKCQRLFHNPHSILKPKDSQRTRNRAQHPSTIMPWSRAVFILIK